MLVLLIFQLENNSIDLSSKIEEISSLKENIIELKQQHNVHLENCQQQQELLQQKYESLQVSGKIYFYIMINIHNNLAV